MYQLYKMFTSALILLNYVFIMNLTSGASVYRKDSVFRTENKVNCTPLPVEVLSEILGPSFNSRYMSIKPPSDEESAKQSPQAIQVKRKTQEVPSFYVDDNYAQQLGNAPAWEMKFIEDGASDYSDSVERDKRAVHRSGSSQEKREPWQCEKKIHWIDLGPDYFPRYLRTVECTKHSCFYGHYRCRPKSFTVRLMRRRSGICVESNPAKKIGVSGLPMELRELWVWEERAVNFCCECAA